MKKLLPSIEELKEYAVGALNDGEITEEEFDDLIKCTTVVEFKDVFLVIDKKRKSESEK